jgi:hypothetical protein
LNTTLFFTPKAGTFINTLIFNKEKLVARMHPRHLNILYQFNQKINYQKQGLPLVFTMVINKVL